MYAKKYKDVRRSPLRNALRHGVLSSLSTLQNAAQHALQVRATRRVQFLVFHHVFTDEAAAFRELLKKLSKAFRLIGYGDAVRKLTSGNVDDAYLALSFDDGLKSCTTAAAILQEFDATACFFVCPTMIGERNYGRIRSFCASQLAMPPTEFLSWTEVDQLLDLGHEIGGHTMNHPNLAQVSPRRATDEIDRSYHVLRQRIGRVDHFSWPFGKFHHFRASAARAVFDAGYVSCASGERGCHVGEKPIATRDLCLRRDAVFARWPWSHVAYFLVRNAANRVRDCATWPDGWPMQTDVGHEVSLR